MESMTVKDQNPLHHYTSFSVVSPYNKSVTIGAG